MSFQRYLEVSLLRAVLLFFGYRVVYRCEWGEYSYRYDSLDRHAGRPIHKGMSVAPPWATRHLVKSNTR